MRLIASQMRFNPVFQDVGTFQSVGTLIVMGRGERGRGREEKEKGKG